MVFDPWHYVPVLARKPGAWRNGAPLLKVIRDAPDVVATAAAHDAGPAQPSRRRLGSLRYFPLKRGSPAG
jgi:hypothetical protein